jgi:hypothetical protein
VKRAGELFARGSKAPAVEGAQKVIDDLHAHLPLTTNPGNKKNVSTATLAKSGTRSIKRR